MQAGAVSENNTLHVMDGKGRVALVRAGNPLPHDATPAVKYPFGDHLGSSNVIVDGTGAFVNREEYTPYGETSFGSFAWKRYRFTGKERDDESGFYYHGARYYSPWFAAWPTCDPAGITDGASLYTYARSNPMRYADPSGCQSDDPKINATKVGDVWELPEVKITGILPTGGDGGYSPNAPGEVSSSASKPAPPSGFEVWMKNTLEQDAYDGPAATQGHELSDEEKRDDEADMAAARTTAHPTFAPNIEGVRREKLFIEAAQIGIGLFDPSVEALELGESEAAGTLLGAPKSAAARSVGAMAADEPLLNWSTESRPTWGHTFATHGEDQLEGLLDRARGGVMNRGKLKLPQQMGYWPDNQAAADFLSSIRPYLNDPAPGISGSGSVMVPLPADVPAQVVLPSGEIVPAAHAELHPNSIGGYKTAFPVVP